MTRKQLNYKPQQFKCCGQCKHSRGDNSSLECSLMSEEQYKVVSYLGICDSFKGFL